MGLGCIDSYQHLTHCEDSLVESVDTEQCQQPLTVESQWLAAVERWAMGFVTLRATHVLIVQVLGALQLQTAALHSMWSIAIRAAPEVVLHGHFNELRTILICSAQQFFCSKLGKLCSAWKLPHVLFHGGRARWLAPCVNWYHRTVLGQEIHL
jgi:hypothetical protein